MRMWREEGYRGFMRGNGINCLRIVPYRYGSSRSPDVDADATASAVQFTTYEQLKKVRRPVYSAPESDPCPVVLGTRLHAARYPDSASRRRNGWHNLSL